MTASIPLRTLRERVWYAWQCLPLDATGELPSWNSLAEDYGFPKSTIGKIMRGHSIRGPTPGRLALALRTTIDWLLENRGAPPKLTGKYKPLPEHFPTEGAFSEEPSPQMEDAREAAIAFALACGVDQRAIDAVRALPPRAYTPREWLARIDFEAAELRVLGLLGSSSRGGSIPPASPLPMTTRSQD